MTKRRLYFSLQKRPHLTPLRASPCCFEMPAALAPRPRRISTAEISIGAPPTPAEGVEIAPRRGDGTSAGEDARVCPRTPRRWWTMDDRSPNSPRDENIFHVKNGEMFKFKIT